MIKNIIFDVGMVLADFRYRDYMKELGFDSETVEFLATNMVETEEWNRLDEGMSVNSFSRFYQEKYPEYSEEIKLFFSDMRTIVKPYSYAGEWIKRYRESGFGVYILSNYSDELFDLHERTVFDFTNEASGIVVSGRVKLRKPNKEIYEYLLNTYMLKAEECVFIDDRKENIDSAMAVGMKGIVFDGYESAEAKIKLLLKCDK